MKIKESPGERVFNVCNILIMIVLLVITLYPILYVLFASFSNPGMLMMKTGPLWKPEGFSLASYEVVFQNPNIWQGYKNTLIILVFGVIINLLLTMIAGYVLSRKYLMLRRFLTLMIVFTMYFNGGLIPFYLTVKNLHLDNSLLSLIIPTAISTYNMIIMRTAFAAVPDSMEESAKLDGANQTTILFRIMVPLVMPTLAVLLLYYGVSHWNSWFNAMIFLNRRRDLFPLQLVLREILVQNSTADMTQGIGMDDAEMVSETIKYSVIVVATVPILLLYPFLQRFFVKGVMIGAVKG